MPTIIRKIAIALLLGLAGVITASAGQYYDLALKAFSSGDYERCIELFEKKIPAEIKQEQKDCMYNFYNWWPYVESAFALKDFKRAFHGITDNHRIINKKYWIDDRWWKLTPRDLELWPEAKKPLLDVILNDFFDKHRDDVKAFRSSPLVMHIAGTGRCTVDDLVAQAAELYWEKFITLLNCKPRYSEIAFSYLCCAAEFDHVVATRVAACAFEQGYIALKDGDNIPVSIDKEKAFYYWRKNSELSTAAGMERIVALYKYAGMLMSGEGTEKNLSAAISCFDKLIDEISEKNFFKSGSYKLRASCYLEMGDTVAFFNKNKEAFELGYNSVAHNLGNCYKSGWGTEINFEKAFEAYSAGMEKQDALSPVVPCKYEVALLLKDGKGCAADPERALELLKEASDAGWIFAQYTLAEEYYKRQQWADAMGLCQIVADREDRIPNAARASVCKMVARMYTYGRGAPGDEALAQQWWDRAATYGDDDADLILQWLGIK